MDSKLTDLVNESTRVTTAVLVLAYLFIAFGCILIVVAVALVVYSSTKVSTVEKNLEIHGQECHVHETYCFIIYLIKSLNNVIKPLNKKFKKLLGKHELI